MDGFLLLFKEKGISSNQLVQKVKKLLSLKKVGHLGTLDPMAEGLLILALNRATRFSSFFLNSDKTYQANVKFGSKTDTDDALGKIIYSSDQIPVESEIDSALKSFIGISKQEAPYFSALKHKGKPLYKYAREGKYISKPPREINIFSIKNIKHTFMECSFQIHCSKGTYIRSIARDLGDNLGCGAHLCGLKRISQGVFNIEDSKSAEEIDLNFLVTIEEAFLTYKKIQLDKMNTKAFLNGVKIILEDFNDNYYRIYDHSSTFLGLGLIRESSLILTRLV
jgi:tRNA pseudouridine55 synthase